MIAASPSFSAELSGFLEVAGRRVPLGQLAPDHCIVRESLTMPPVHAEILLISDGNETRYPVFLPHGISPQSARVVFQPLTKN